MAQERDGVFTWIHADHLSSATRITDVNGLEVRRLAYASFGEEAENQGTGDDPKYTYTGKEADSTGLYYYGARYYDPALSRFITADTVYDTGPQGLNRYSYALNNPIIYRDPSGHLSYADEQDPQVWEDPSPPEVEDHKAENDPPPWWETPGSTSPTYEWKGPQDITTMDLQMAPYAGGCEWLARQNGYQIYPGYGHVEVWTTTEDGRPACYYRPAEWWEPGLNYVASEVLPFGALVYVGYVAVSPSQSVNNDRNTVLRRNQEIGNNWDEYVANTKLKKLDDAGLLNRQERLPTPDIPGKEFVIPDYTIYNTKGGVAAYADAKSGAIVFDAQAKGLIKWSTVTESKTLIYYTPQPTTVPRSMIQYATNHDVTIRVITVR